MEKKEKRTLFIAFFAIMAVLALFIAACAVMGNADESPKTANAAETGGITLTDEEFQTSIGLHQDFDHTGATALTQAMVDAEKTYAAGNYYLSENIELDGRLSFSGNANLCLNGKTLGVKTDNNVSTMINTSGDLSLYDCEGGGIITGSKRNGYDATLSVKNFYMHGGVIAGNEMVDNDYVGGILVNESEAVIDGGVIKDNSGYQLVWVENNGFATFKNCMITGNSFGFIATNMMGLTYNYENCRITDNQMSIPIYGGTVGNNVVIQRNSKVSYYSPNFFIGSEGAQEPCYINITDNTEIEDYDSVAVITFNAPLAEGSKIQVNKAKVNTKFTENYGVYHANVDPNKFFVNTATDHKFFFDTASSEVMSRKIRSWNKEYARDNWVYGSEASAETEPVEADNASVTIEYFADADYTEQYTGTFDATTPAGTYYVRCYVAVTETHTELEGKYSFEVTPKPLTDAMVGNVDGTFTYNGKEHKPTVTVTDATLTAEDFFITWSTNVNAGEATLTVTGIGNYTGTIIRTFTIAKAAIIPSVTLENLRMGRRVIP